MIVLTLPIIGIPSASARPADDLASLGIKDRAFAQEWISFVEARTLARTIGSIHRSEAITATSVYYERHHEFVNAFADQKIERFMLAKYAAVAARQSRLPNGPAIYRASVEEMARTLIYLIVDLQTARPARGLLPAVRAIDRARVAEVVELTMRAALMTDAKESASILGEVRDRVTESEFLDQLARSAKWRDPIAAAQRWTVATVIWAATLGRGGFVSAMVMSSGDVHREVGEALAPNSTSPCRRLLTFDLPDEPLPRFE